MAVCMVSGRKRDVITLKHRLPQPKTGCAKHAYQGLFLGTFLVFFLATTSHLDNVTEGHRYSRLLPDFTSVRVCIISTVRKGPF